MKYLLDVNALIALGVLEHEFHVRVFQWVAGLTSNGRPDLATCSITELGFVRVLAQAPQYGFTVRQACGLLQQLKVAGVVNFSFIPDGLVISHLPIWVKSAKQTTDGHLAQLASANAPILPTLASGIPRAYLIPAER